jgi:hypothetical protein
MGYLLTLGTTYPIEKRDFAEFRFNFGLCIPRGYKDKPESNNSCLVGESPTHLPVAGFTYDEASFADMVKYALQHYQENDFAPRGAIGANETARRMLVLYGELTGRKWTFFATLEEARHWADSRMP